MKWIISFILILVLLLCTGCLPFFRSDIAEGSTVGDKPERSSQGFLDTATLNKLAGFLVLIGVGGVAAVFMMKNAVFWAVPIACAGGVLFLKFVSKFGDLLAWGMLVLVVVFLFVMIKRYKDVAKYAIGYGQQMKKRVSKKAIEQINELATDIQPIEIRKEIRRIKSEGK